MAYIIDGKKYDSNTSEKLHDSGDYQAMAPSDGLLEVYRSPKGTLWARLYYWPSETHDAEVLVAGDEAVRRLILRARRPHAIEEVFGPVEEG